jgi:hypothetical protein
MIFFGCNKNNPSESTDNSDIPEDPTNVTVPATQHDNIVPSATFSPPTGNRVVVNLQGLLNPSTNLPIDLFADYVAGNYNFYLEEDGILKGVKLTKVSTGNVLKADIVFTIDISGSMNEEADSVANGVIDFANVLASSGLDINFACVGYYGYIAGALNFTDAGSLEDFLNKSTGTYRPQGFWGPDSIALQTAAWSYASQLGSYDENGAMAIQFADSLFNWRSGAQRVFVNFTDEPTQPNGYDRWSTSYLCDVMAGRATVHTVYSGPADTSSSLNGSWQILEQERPWKMSECTGGTMLFISETADSLNLSTLPVTGTLSNSYKVEFLSASPADSHVVAITIKVTGADGRIEYDKQIYGQ